MNRACVRTATRYLMSISRVTEKGGEKKKNEEVTQFWEGERESESSFETSGVPLIFADKPQAQLGCLPFEPANTKKEVENAPGETERSFTTSGVPLSLLLIARVAYLPSEIKIFIKPPAVARGVWLLSDKTAAWE